MLPLLAKMLRDDLPGLLVRHRSVDYGFLRDEEPGFEREFAGREQLADFVRMTRVQPNRPCRRGKRDYSVFEVIGAPVQKMAAQRNDRLSAQRVRDKDIATFAEEHKGVCAILPSSDQRYSSSM